MKTYKRILFAILISLNSTTQASNCKAKSAAADYICKIKNSQRNLDLKYRYKKNKKKSLSLEYRKGQKGPYAQEFFIVKVDSALQKNTWKNCLLFGLFGKCIKKKINLCSSRLTAVHFETSGLNKYRRAVVFDTQNKKGIYTYFRKTPKASAKHRLQSFKIEFENCRSISRSIKKG